MKKKLLLVFIIFIITSLFGCSFLSPKALISKSLLKTLSANQLETICNGDFETNVYNQIFKDKKIPFSINTQFNKGKGIMKYYSILNLKIDDSIYNFKAYFDTNKFLVSNNKGWLEFNQDDYSSTIEGTAMEKALEERIMSHIFDSIDSSYFKSEPSEEIEINKEIIKTDVVSISLNNEQTYAFLYKFSNLIATDRRLNQIIYNEESPSRDFLGNKQKEYEEIVTNFKDKVVFEGTNIKFYIDKEGFTKKISYQVKVNKNQSKNVTLDLNGEIMFNHINDNSLVIEEPKTNYMYNNINDFFNNLI